MNKKYAAMNRKTGKMSRTFATREEARTFKRSKNFRYSIVNLMTQAVVR
jgi:hypothetical protein